MDLSNLNVVQKANAGSVLELTYPGDYTDEKTGVSFEKGEVITSDNGEYQKEIDAINADSKLSDDEKAKAVDKVAKPKPFFVRLLGTDSDVYRKSTNRRLEKTLNKKNKNQSIDLDDMKIKAAELLAKCTTECFMIESGKEVLCSQAEMTRLYLGLPWLKEQAEEFMDERSNFMTS